jgi:hypothetical protein
MRPWTRSPPGPAPAHRYTCRQGGCVPCGTATRGRASSSQQTKSKHRCPASEAAYSTPTFPESQGHPTRRTANRQHAHEEHVKREQCHGCSAGQRSIRSPNSDSSGIRGAGRWGAGRAGPGLAGRVTSTRRRVLGPGCDRAPDREVWLLRAGCETARICLKQMGRVLVAFAATCGRPPPPLRGGGGGRFRTRPCCSGCSMVRAPSTSWASPVTRCRRPDRGVSCIVSRSIGDPIGSGRAF